MLSGLVAHYRVVSTLGAGGMGVVHKAIDTRLNRPVAIKAIPEGLGLETAAVLRLRAEAQSAASLDHPYICKIYELLDTDSGTLIVMEFVEGETLASMLLREGPLPVPLVMRYAAEIAEGLAAAHATGLIHRDVKPSNVMITPHNHVKLLDFGIAHNPATASGTSTTQSMQTRPGSVAGSPFYMAPEQALGRTVDGRTDVFSLGALLFECLTGKLPFEGTTRDAYVLDMLTGRPRSLVALAPHVPQPIADLVASCLDRNPELRPDAASVAAYLRAEAPTGSTDRFFLPQRRSWKQIALVSLLFLALAVPAAWGIYRWLVPVAAPGLGRQEALITWESEDFDPRISPDGKWVSFLSNRDGPIRLFVTSSNRDEASPLTAAEFTPLSHVWSPDSSEVAVILRTKEGTFVHVLSAPVGGSVRRSFPLNERPTLTTTGVRLARWIGSSLYLVVASSPGAELWRIDLESAQREEVSEKWTLPVTPLAFDVSPDGRRVVFAGISDGQEDLWVVNVDGRDSRRLTRDAHNERVPMWSGDGRSVVFQSTRSGQLDLWFMDVNTGQTWQLTSGQAEELFGESTANGGLEVFQSVVENANLWKQRPGSSAAIQLTSDTLSDFGPTFASPDVITFQRSLPILPLGSRLFDSRLLVGRLTGDSFAVRPQPLDDGFAPQVSPNGRYVAYFQRPQSPDVPRLALRVRDLQSGQVFQVDSPAALLNASGMPLGWIGPVVAWNAITNDMYFIGSEEGGVYSIRKIANDQFNVKVASSGNTVISQKVLAGGPREQLTDLHVAPNGRSLGYLRFDARAVDPKVRKAELREMDLNLGTDRVVRSEPWPSGRSIYYRGWLGTGDSHVLVDQVRRTGRIARIGLVSSQGEWREVASLEEAFASSAKVDASRGLLYIARAEGGIHNVFVITLQTGDIRRVTNNARLGHSFSSLEILPDGSLVYAIDRRISDIWIIRHADR